MMTPVAEILQRAKLRISAHGHRQGAAVERPKGKRPNPGFSGYSLIEAVCGIPVAGQPKEISADETEALRLVEEAIRLLYREFAASYPGPALILAFNDEPGRKKDELIAVLQRAQVVARSTARTPAHDDRAATAENGHSEMMSPDKTAGNNEREARMPDIGPKADLTASDGLEGIITTTTTAKRAPLALVGGQDGGPFPNHAREGNAS